MYKTKLTGSWFRQVLVVGICLGVAGSGAKASTLWSNSPAVTNYQFITPYCDSNCGSPGAVPTIFDQFTVGSIAWIVTGFNLTDFFVNTPVANYRSTNWSIWSGDPFAGGTIVASGNATPAGGLPTNVVGNCSGAQCSATISITGLTPVVLGAGTYYLGTNNVLSSSADSTQRAFVDAGNTCGPPPFTQACNTGFEQGQVAGGTFGSKGSSFSPQGCNFPNTCIGGLDTAFDITGSLAPEPGTMVLMSLALVGFGYKRLRRRT